MNLLFWKKKKNDGAGDTDKTEIAAARAGSAPPKPGWLGRLKAAMGRKRRQHDEEKAVLPAEREDKRDRPGDGIGAETARKPVKPGMFARLTGLFPRSKKTAPEEETKRHAGSRGKKSGEEPEQPPTPAVKSWKRPLLGLILLTLLAGVGFAAWNWLRPVQPPIAKPQEEPAAPETKEAEAPQPAPASGEEPAFAAPMTGTAAPQQALDATAAPDAAVAAPASPSAGEPQAAASGQAGEDVQAQIEVLKKQNQDMQAQIEALKKQGAHPANTAYRPNRIPPKDGVLIINGKDSKASAQALKHVIEEMNGDPESPDAKKAGK